MRRLLRITGFVTGSLLLVACSSGATKTTPATAPTTSIPSPTTSIPSTTLAAGETSKLAELASQPPPGYRFVDAPASLSQELQSELRSIPAASQIIKGFSLHAIVLESTGATIGDAVLLHVEPVATGAVNVEDLFLTGAGASPGQIKHVDLGGITWSTATVNLDGSSQVYVHLEQDVLYVLTGTDSTRLQAFILAAQHNG